MAESGKTSSRVPAVQQANSFVLDFFYQDVRRVGSFLAQLNPGGHTQSVKNTVAREESGGIDASMTVKGSIKVVEGSSGTTTREGNVNRDTLERTIDPLWANAIDLLNLLEQNRMIERDLGLAGLGSVGHLYTCLTH